MIPWERLATAVAPDGEALELRRRGKDFVIRAGGHELMSSEDEGSSRALAELGCAHVPPRGRVIVGGLGMGFTLRAALDHVGPGASVEIAELVPAVVEWNEGPFDLGALAGHPLRDPRVTLRVGDVRQLIKEAKARYDAILLDVDNGPIALAHDTNDAIYGVRGTDRAYEALRPGGVLGVWSLADDRRYTARLERRGFEVEVHRVPGSRRGRGKEHVVWIARRPAKPAGDSVSRSRDGAKVKGRKTR
jgi:spermidine synthase